MRIGVINADVNPQSSLSTRVCHFPNFGGHDDVIKWKHFPRYWSFVRGIHRSPAQRPVTRSFDVFFDLRLKKQLSKQWWGWWFETLSRPLWRHCDVAGTSAATVLVVIVLELKMHVAPKYGYRNGLFYSIDSNNCRFLLCWSKIVFSLLWNESILRKILYLTRLFIFENNNPVAIKYASPSFTKFLIV